MKEKIFPKMALMLVCMLIALSSLASALPRSYSLQVNLVNQEPDPVEPGHYVDVRFRIENIGSSSAEGVVLELMPEFPFRLAPGDTPIKGIGTINSREVDELGTIVKYRLLVDENAVEGPNDLKLKYTIKGFSSTELDPFIIDVRTPDAIISVEEVKISSDSIVPGEKSVVSITLKNNADSVLRDIKASLQLSGLPLATIDSTNELMIKSMDAGQEKTVAFNLAAEPTADSSLYKVPLKLDYKDELGNLFSRNETFGLVIGDIPDLAVSLRSSGLVSSNSKGRVTVQFVNKGVTGIKFLYVALKETDEFKIIGADIAYLGKIDSDDYETADFDIFVMSEDDIRLPIFIEYRDANNKLFTRTENILVPIYSSAESKQLGLAGSSGFIGPLITVLIIVVGVLGYVFYRKRKKKK